MERFPQSNIVKERSPQSHVTKERFPQFRVDEKSSPHNEWSPQSPVHRERPPQFPAEKEGCSTGNLPPPPRPFFPSKFVHFETCGAQGFHADSNPRPPPRGLHQDPGPTRREERCDGRVRGGSAQEWTSGGGIDDDVKTMVYARIAEVFTDEMVLHGYLAHRVTPRLRFKLVALEIDYDARNTIVTLCCASRCIATRFRQDLDLGNAHSPTKVWCFDSLREALQQVMRPHHELQRSYDDHLQQMRRRSEAVLGKHYDKVTEVEGQLKALRGDGNKHMSLQQFNERQSSVRALEDRLKELRLQQEEFMSYLKDCFTKLREVREGRDFEAAATNLRHELAGECNRLAKAFPIYARRSDILAAVRENQVCVVVGETGSGKSTQMAQFFYHAGLASDGLIACTQPRKIAATSLASHVAVEMGTSVGQLVGYKVGLQTRRTNRTRILYLTDHVLLNECLRDQTLSEFSVIIIDEAHERSIHTDLLLGMLKDCLQARPKLRLVVTSATIDPEVFVRYFGSCPVLTVSGRMFPVEVEWAEPVPGVDSFDNHEVKAVRKAVEVHLGEAAAAGDVLVFLTSPLETERCCQMFQDLLEGRPTDYVALQLHGRLQGDEQQRVFEAPPVGKRKVVFATNSAETSVTIPGIRFVIDTGLVKEIKFDPIRKISRLGVRLVAQSSARQRQGRAGRLGPGKCFRLYTEEDFRAMDASSLPEILRVHVGHALLKLLELGVDPLKFDFISAPSSSAMDEALAGLLALGAVAGGSITPLGKWIAKMPFEPKYGMLVHDAVQAGAGLEAVVVAAASGAGSVFYRAGNSQEKDDADRKKVRFCHEGGDQLTTLNVFRAWHAIPQRDKGRWCVSHAVNGKTLKAILEITNEVVDILRREFDVKLQFPFKEDGALDVIVSGLLLRALKENLSHYLGHPRAGYSAVLKDQRVELHPSSVLLPLNSWPQWLVFDQVMQTSRDFAMQVTPVQEEAVVNAVRQGWLQLDVEQARRKRLATVCQEVAGPQLFRETVGPRYAALRDLESQLAASHPQCLVVLEADQERGELRVLSTDHQHPAPTLTRAFSSLLLPLKDKFRAEESEQPLGLGLQVRAGVRAVLGAGAAVVTLLMPQEYTTVLVRCSLYHIEDLSEREVIKAFGKHGKVKYCFKFFRKSKTSTTWGKVVYEECEAAAAAVRESCERQRQDKENRDHKGDGGQPDQQDQPELSALPNIHLSDSHGETFKIKIQWCRRRSKGFGYVTFAHVEDYHRVLMECRLNGLIVGTSRALVKNARQTPQCLYVSSLGPLVTEDVLRAAFADRFGLHPLQDVTKVVVVREQRQVYPEELHACRRQLLLKIEEFAPHDKFLLEVREPRSARDINFIAYCSFRCPQQGHAACAALNNGFTLSNSTVSVRPDIHSSLFVHRDVFQQSRKEVEALLARLQESDQIRIKMKPLKNGAVILDFHTEDAHALGRARASLQEVLTGEVVECDDRAAISARLFSREGRRVLEGIMQQTNTLVVADTRLLTVSVHGPQQQRQAAVSLIKQYLRDSVLEHHRDVEMRGGVQPQGLMKALMLRYGTDLEGLRTAAGLGRVQLQLRQHRLRLGGTQKAVEQAVNLLDEVAATLSVEGAASSSEEEPECVVCLCPVENGQLYRVECCGHAYCRECVGMQVSTALTAREFPLQCASEGCFGLLVWRDLLNLSRLGLLSVSSLVAAAVAAYVQRNHQLFHYCLTPDCPSVYRTSPTGACFNCSECSVRVCTKCHVQYHDGLTCSMFGSLGRDAANLLAWLNEDPTHRKICPNCSTPIEKVAGCNKMTCTACSKVLCWVCLAVFDTEQECYGHLASQHNGFT